MWICTLRSLEATGFRKFMMTTFSYWQRLCGRARTNGFIVNSGSCGDLLEPTGCSYSCISAFIGFVSVLRYCACCITMEYRLAIWNLSIAAFQLAITFSFVSALTKRIGAMCSTRNGLNVSEEFFSRIRRLKIMMLMNIIR